MVKIGAISITYMKLRNVAALQITTFFCAGLVWPVFWQIIGFMENQFHLDNIRHNLPYDRSNVLHGAAESIDDYRLPSLHGMKIETKVVMFVPSPVSWEERRRHVYLQFERESWTDEQVILLFVFGNRSGERLLGFVNTSGVVQHPRATNVVVNCRDFGDEFDGIDETSSTTCKVYKSMQYVAANYRAKYVWRGADDSYVNLTHFFSMMPALPATRLFFGSLRKAQNVQLDLSLFIQPRLAALLGLRQFGQYMFGSGFVLSYDVVDFVASLKIPPHLTWCEDVMVGMWLNPFQIEFRHSPDIIDQYFRLALPGKNYLLIHRMLPEQWAQINSRGWL
jgi:hypothetical protein